MKKLIIFLALIILIVGCTSKNDIINNSSKINESNNIINKTNENIVNISDSLSLNPVSIFTKEDIDSLGVNCSGTDEQIAECIYDWQAENMIFTPTNLDKGPFNQPYPIRWNSLLPGIFTSKDVITNQISTSGKVYGICFDFATVYCSIANYYGLECRLMETGININNETRVSGMSQAEYEEFFPWILKAGLNYSYDSVRLSMPEDSEVPGHIWAEVKLTENSNYDDGLWRIMDASNQKYDGRSMTLTHINEGKSYIIVNWSSKDRRTLLQYYEDRINNGEDLSRESKENISAVDSFLEGRNIFADDVKAGRQEAYEGITDELGNTNRAEIIDDFMQGKGLAPFYSSCNDVCNFFSGTISNCLSSCEEEPEFYSDYKTCSGDDFFIICDFVCGDYENNVSEFASCYKSCSGTELNIECNES